MSPGHEQTAAKMVEYSVSNLNAWDHVTYVSVTVVKGSLVTSKMQPKWQNSILYHIQYQIMLRRYRCNCQGFIDQC